MTRAEAAAAFERVRPQPLGALAWPAGMLVLPDVEGAPAVAAALVAGGEPEVWPAPLRFVQVALEGDSPRSADLVEGDDLVARYNRAVLVGGDRAWDALVADATGPLAALVATARFSLGLTDEVPTAEGVDGEVAAVVRSARASAALERSDLEAALAELDQASSAALDGGSAILSASLRGTRAELYRAQADEPERAEADAGAALAVLPGSADPELRAELLVTRALARQQCSIVDPTRLAAAVADFQEALKTYREDTHPELFAVCNQHLAVAYLSMPMNDRADRIRVGVAVSALRAALRVFTPETHPVGWASTQLNLANALQYLPSAHQERNLDEAVQIYEELLAWRDPKTDPLGVARILANQGNALGHLGAFADGRERLGRARELFLVGGDPDGVAGVDEVLAGLAAAEGAAGRRAGAVADPAGGVA